VVADRVEGGVWVESFAAGLFDANRVGMTRATTMTAAVAKAAAVRR
jgi:hypothetical protein